MRLISGSRTFCPLCFLDWNHRECINVTIPERDR